MVNSPSRPNLRPPAPVECGGMTPLWNRETCLPVHRPSGSHRPQSDQIKPNQTMPPHFVCSRRSRLPSRWPSARTKAKNPAIKANRASSRQTPNFRSAPVPGPSKHQTCRRIVMPYPSIPPRPPETRNPQTETRFSANQASIKAENPCNRASSRHIKAPAKKHPPLGRLVLGASLCAFAFKNPGNQGSSCLIKANAIFPNHHQFGEPTRWMGRIGRRMVKSCTQEKSSPGGDETGEGERHHQSIPDCANPGNQGKKPCNRA